MSDVRRPGLWVRALADAIVKPAPADFAFKQLTTGDLPLAGNQRSRWPHCRNAQRAIAGQRSAPPMPMPMPMFTLMRIGRPESSAVLMVSVQRCLDVR